MWQQYSPQYSQPVSFPGCQNKMAKPSPLPSGQHECLAVQGRVLRHLRWRTSSSETQDCVSAGGEVCTFLLTWQNLHFTALAACATESTKWSTSVAVLASGLKLAAWKQHRRVCGRCIAKPHVSGRKKPGCEQCDGRGKSRAAPGGGGGTWQQWQQPETGKRRGPSGQLGDRYPTNLICASRAVAL